MSKIFKINEANLKPLGPRDPSIVGRPRCNNILINSGEWSSGIRPVRGRM